MGIGGSGMSGVALTAHEMGFEVSGCDLEDQTPYIEKLKKLGIKIYHGHDPNHLNNVDILCVTPAAFFLNPDHPEFVEGKGKNLMTWQAFLGRILQKDKRVICVAGTHGKSTTTSMLSLLLEAAGLDPSAMVGATLPRWGSNCRVGKSDIFVTESDEFYDNFLNYTPDILILNNIEFDHPDYFKDEKQLFESFKKHLLSLKGEKVLIYNQDSPGVTKLLKLLSSGELSALKLHGYSLKNMNIKLTSEASEFEFENTLYKIKVAGKHNISNALGVIICGRLLGVQTSVIKKSLLLFEGIGRRMELLGTKNGINVFDDYAHHPTAIKVTFEALRQKFPKSKILAIVEPHTFSRTKALLPLYKNVFDDADEVIIAPIFRSRDKEDFGISGQSIVEISNHKKINYLDSYEEIISYSKQNVKNGDVIIVMGAGNSYKLSRDILSII